MNKILSITFLAIILNLFALQTSFAHNSIKVFNGSVKEQGWIHFTHFHVSDRSKQVWLTDYIYIGEKNAVGDCIPKQLVGEPWKTFVMDGMSMGIHSDLFSGQSLSANSCALEQFHIKDSGNIHAVQYTLINDGKDVIAANPASQDLNLDNNKKN